MSNNITEIQTALYNHLLTTPGLPSPADIERENERYVPDIRTNWARVTMLPSETAKQSLGLGGYNTLQGVYQVSLFYPAGRTSIDDINIMADAVVDNFVSAIFLNEGSSTVNVIDAWRDVGITESDWFNLPIFIRWESQQTR